LLLIAGCAVVYAAVARARATRHASAPAI